MGGPLRLRCGLAAGSYPLRWPGALGGCAIQPGFRNSEPGAAKRSFAPVPQMFRCCQDSPLLRVTCKWEVAPTLSRAAPGRALARSRELRAEPEGDRYWSRRSSSGSPPGSPARAAELPRRPAQKEACWPSAARCWPPCWLRPRSRWSSGAAARWVRRPGTGRGM